MAEEIKPQFAEDEELERAKAWWKENGRSITAGIVIGLSGVIGFNFWQGYQQTQAENASILFEQLRSAGETGSSVEVIANELINEYASTPYADHAALALAKTAVESNELDDAQSHLQWVLDHSDDEGLLHIARLRLVSVHLARGETSQAASLLKVENRGAYGPRYDELSGDISALQGDTDAARAAYQRSLDDSSPGDFNRALIQLKLDNLGQ